MFRKFKQAISLSKGLSNKSIVCYWYLYLTIKGKFGFSQTLKNPQRLGLNFQNNKFDFYIDSKNDFDVLWSVFGNEEWSLGCISSVECVLDLGAYTGATSIYFALKYPRARVYAFEPEQKNQKRFELNTKSYGNRIILVKKLVSSQSGKEVKLFSPTSKVTDLSASVFQTNTASEYTYATTISLDDFIKSQNINSIDIIKFNIEGSEFDVFKHFRYLHSVKHLIGEVHPDLVSKTVGEFENIFANDFSIIQLQALKHGRRLIRLDRLS